MRRPVHLLIDPSLCHSCPHCQAKKACRMKAIIQIDPGEPPYMDSDRCLDCRVCVAACPYGAVRVQQRNGQLLYE